MTYSRAPPTTHDKPRHRYRDLLNEATMILVGTLTTRASGTLHSGCELARELRHEIVLRAPYAPQGRIDLHFVDHVCAVNLPR